MPKTRKPKRRKPPARRSPAAAALAKGPFKPKVVPDKRRRARLDELERQAKEAVADDDAAGS
jgi:hypothetical protein